MKKELILKNEISEVSQLEDFINFITEELQLDMSLSFNLNLALEEVVVNVIEYAYPSDETHTFSIIAQGDPGDQLTLEVIDDGLAFDPTNDAPEVDTTLGVEERPIGGLGIFLVKKIMDEVTYQRTNNQNVLTMKKKLSN